MASNLTDAMLAGPLLADLLAYMQNATRAVDAGLEVGSGLCAGSFLVEGSDDEVGCGRECGRLGRQG